MLTFKTPAPNRPSPLSTFSLGLIGVPLLALGALAVPESASAGQFTTLYNFAGGNDGCNGSGPLILDSFGDVHGVTYIGGTSNAGTVFSVPPGVPEDTVQQSFGVYDGANPTGGLIYDSAGNLYGTTRSAGSYNSGTVFKLAPDGNLTTLHTFTGAQAFTGDSSDGANPEAGLVADSAGNLYGTTEFGGSFGDGTVFKLASDGSTYTVVHSFNGDDGAMPSSDLVFDEAGNLYGTTFAGSPFENGTVFELTTGGLLFTKYYFTGQADGAGPTAGLVFDRAGNLYGTTSGIGLGVGLSTYTSGNVFELASNGTFTVLYSFSGGSDGNDPLSDLIFDSAGNLYGTTVLAGAFGNGTVFRLSPNSSGKLMSFEVLASLPSGPIYSAGPLGGLVLDRFGTLYGTSIYGGPANCGIVYEISGAAPAGPTLTASPASLTFQPGDFTRTGYALTFQTVTISVKGGNYIPKTPLLTGPNANQFGIESNSCTGTIASGGSCAIKLAYVRPASQPTYQESIATLNLTGDAALAISLTGEE